MAKFRISARRARAQQRCIEAVSLGDGCVFCSAPTAGGMWAIFQPPSGDLDLWGGCNVFAYHICGACELRHGGPGVALFEAAEGAIARRLVSALGEAQA